MSLKFYHVKYYFLQILFFFTTTVSGQQLDFAKYYSLFQYNYANALCVTHDNYRLVTGYTTLHTADIYYLMKLDSQGNFIWSQFGDVQLDGGYTDGRVVLELSNGNYAVGCRTCCGSSDLFIAIYDTAGNLLQRKHYHTVEDLNITNMIELNGSLYIFGRFSTSSGFMCKTDLNADTVFILKNLPYGLSNNKQSVLLLNDRFILGNGIYDSVATTFSPLLTIIDTTGAIINQWHYPQITGFVESLCNTYDNGYVFSNVYPNGGLNKIDSAGNLLWSNQNILSINQFLFSVDTNVLVVEDQYFFWYDTNGQMIRYSPNPLGLSGEASIDQNHILLCGAVSPDSVYYAQFSDSMITNIRLVQSLILNIYPNPASTHITVLTEKFHNGEIIVTNLISQEVMRIPLHSSQQIEIDIRKLSPGIYNLLLFDLSGNLNYAKFIVSR